MLAIFNRFIVAQPSLTAARRRLTVAAASEIASMLSDVGD